MKTVSGGEICELKFGAPPPEKFREPGPHSVFGSNGQVGRHSEALTSGPTIIFGRKGSIGKICYPTSGCWPIDTTYFVESSCTNQDLRWLMYALDSLGLDGLNNATG